MPGIIRPHGSDPIADKCCPWIPPVITQEPDPVLPGKLNVSYKFMPCMGERCRVWDACQGDYSPVALENARRVRLNMLLEAAEQIVAAIPFASSAKGILSSLKARLFSGFKSA